MTNIKQLEKELITKKLKLQEKELEIMKEETENNLVNIILSLKKCREKQKELN